jgi:hypothetical protein
MKVIISVRFPNVMLRLAASLFKTKSFVPVKFYGFYYANNIIFIMSLMKTYQFI